MNIRLENYLKLLLETLNFDPIKELLKIRCHIYILMKKVRSTILHHGKKLNIFTPQLSMQY